MNFSLPPRKPLPRTFRSRTLAYDYGLVKFRNRREGYYAKRQKVDFDILLYTGE